MKNLATQGSGWPEEVQETWVMCLTHSVHSTAERASQVTLVEERGEVGNVNKPTQCFPARMPSPNPGSIKVRRLRPKDKKQGNALATLVLLLAMRTGLACPECTHQATSHSATATPALCKALRHHHQAST